MLYGRLNAQVLESGQAHLVVKVYDRVKHNAMLGNWEYSKCVRWVVAHEKRKQGYIAFPL